MLIVPLIDLAPDEQLPRNRVGPSLICETWLMSASEALYVSSYILESPDSLDGDVLTQAALWDQNEEALRRADDAVFLSGLAMLIVWLKGISNLIGLKVDCAQGSTWSPTSIQGGARQRTRPAPMGAPPYGVAFFSNNRVPVLQPV